MIDKNKALAPDRVVLLKAKGAFRSQPTDVVLGEEDRARVTARLASKGSWGVLELAFAAGPAPAWGAARDRG
jgi:hypothetical protein